MSEGEYNQSNKKNIWTKGRVSNRRAEKICKIRDFMFSRPITK
jgi:hypothetical protein